jgi:hypothetical protein
VLQLLLEGLAEQGAEGGNCAVVCAVHLQTDTEEQQRHQQQQSVRVVSKCGDWGYHVPTFSQRSA